MSGFNVPTSLLRAAVEEPASSADEATRIAPRQLSTFVGVPAALVAAAFLATGSSWLVAVPILVAFVVPVILRLDAERQARWEEREVLEHAGLDGDSDLAPTPRLGLVAVAQRLAARRGMRDVLAVAVVVGAAGIGVPLFLGRVLARVDHVAHGGHRVVATAAVVGVVVGILVATAGRPLLLSRLERFADPDRAVAGGAFVVAGGCLAGAAFARAAPWLPGALLALGDAAVVAGVIATGRCLVVSTNGRERPAAWFLSALYAVVIGAGAGGTALDLIASSGTPRDAVLVLAATSLAVGGWVAVSASAGMTAREGRDVTVAVLERRAAQERLEAGITPPAVEVVGVDFAFGAQPVLRNVSLEVAPGEIAALLGTNGAGKSTLLRVVAGLLLPTRGIVRIEGTPTDAIGAERLGRHHVALVLGGAMTFPGLTVAETLRLTSLGVDDPADFDEVYGRFPVLWHRRTQPTGTLSGGEQQMLALGRALITRPRLLLIDELTLGLAPKIVADLVDLVRELNARGSTVVLVEQSVNLATALATHAFFLERGEVRFDGPIDDLLGRDDLLRSVFLAGAAL